MRLTANHVRTRLNAANPGLFTHSNGLRLIIDFTADEDFNTEGVYIARPDVNTNLQVATLGNAVTVYDEETLFDIKMVVGINNSNDSDARVAIESLVTDSMFDDFYSRSFVVDETYNQSNISFDYTFQFNRTIVKGDT